MMPAADTPFPLEGGRAGDGGEIASRKITVARRLRREMTLAERLLWAELRKLNLNFRRQAPIGRYVADFAHHASRLIVEIDGPSHDAPDAQTRDTARTAWLNAAGYRVIRYPEKTVRDELFSIVDQIAAEAASPPSPALPPSRGKGVR